MWEAVLTAEGKREEWAPLEVFAEAGTQGQEKGEAVVAVVQAGDDDARNVPEARQATQ